MKKFIMMLLRHWAKTPLKISLTVLAVALGSGILILSLSAGSIIHTQITQKLSKQGTILYAANGTWGTDGSIDLKRPGEWDTNVTKIVVSDIDSVKAAAPVNSTRFDEINVGTKSYRVRNAAGTTPGYFDVFDLKLVSGVLMTDADVTAGNKKAWISESMAVALFGSAEKAINQTVTPPGRLFFRGPGQNEAQAIISNYKIAGVYADPGEVARRSYGIADMLTPYTSDLPAGMNVSIMTRLMMGSIVMRSDASSVANIGASVRKVITENYGADTAITVWEGSPRGESSYLNELRQAINIFSVSVNILGMVLLLISTLGIFSIMVVESLSRKRDIALERAIGASKTAVIKEFWIWSLLLSLIGALIGLILAFLLSGPVLGTLNPLIGEVSGGIVLKTGLTWSAALSGILLALGCGGVLGLLPAFGAVRGNISDVLREV